MAGSIGPHLPGMLLPDDLGEPGGGRDRLDPPGLDDPPGDPAAVPLLAIFEEQVGQILLVQGVHQVGRASGRRSSGSNRMSSGPSAAKLNPRCVQRELVRRQAQVEQDAVHRRRSPGPPAPRPGRCKRHCTSVTGSPLVARAARASIRGRGRARSPGPSRPTALASAAACPPAPRSRRPGPTPPRGASQATTSSSRTGRWTGGKGVDSRDTIRSFQPKGTKEGRKAMGRSVTLRKGTLDRRGNPVKAGRSCVPGREPRPSRCQQAGRDCHYSRYRQTSGPVCMANRT